MKYQRWYCRNGFSNFGQVAVCVDVWGLALKAQQSNILTDHLVLPVSGWMQTLRHGLTVACGEAAVGWGTVANKDGGPSMAARSQCPRLSTHRWCEWPSAQQRLSLLWEAPPALQPHTSGPWCSLSSPCRILSREGSWLWHHSGIAAGWVITVCHLRHGELSQSSVLSVFHCEPNVVGWSELWIRQSASVSNSFLMSQRVFGLLKSWIVLSAAGSQ